MPPVPNDYFKDYTLKIIPGCGAVKVPNHPKAFNWREAWFYAKCVLFILGLAFLASR